MPSNTGLTGRRVAARINNNYAPLRVEPMLDVRRQSKKKMITADQILAHLFGDYILQSDWMANEKTKQSFAAACHALSYALPFLFFRPSLAAFAFIVGTHFVIDRWRLARYVVYAKNFLSPRDTMLLVQVPSTPEASSPSGLVNRWEIMTWWHPWSECRGTGYHKDRPAWMTVWLLIIADNALHLLCNGLAIRYL